MTIIANSIKDTFSGIHSSQLRRGELRTLDKHPLFFVWDKIHTIEQQFPRKILGSFPCELPLLYQHSYILPRLV